MFFMLLKKILIASQGWVISEVSHGPFLHATPGSILVSPNIAGSASYWGQKRFLTQTTMTDSFEPQLMQGGVSHCPCQHANPGSIFDRAPLFTCALTHPYVSPKIA